mgnify:CR=1 FL=1
MIWFRWVKEGRWASALGFVFFVGMMAVGYYYNITFVQLGLVDLGKRLLGLSEITLALDMALMALLTSLTAIVFGLRMKRSSWGTDFKVKLRWAFSVILVQTGLTLSAPWIQSQGQLLVWILLTSLALGVGVPVTFSMTVDLIPARDRGYAAAWITGLVYGAAPAASGNWLIETFSRQMLWIMPAGVIGLGWLAFIPNPLVKVWKEQHRDPAFAHGMYSRQGTRSSHRRQVAGLIILMFAIFFVDSLGFLRIIDTPLYIHNNWLSADLGPRLLLGGVHALAAGIAGVLYTNLDLRSLFLWVFGIFALVHLMYTMETRVGPGLSISLAVPLLYAVAVSLYTVINFAVWADLSTPENISLNAALGVALSGWTATFLSTALSLQWKISGMSLERHLSLVDSLALLIFVLMLAAPFLPARLDWMGED